ncbi:MAG TPA: hypothetical protein VLG38_02715, partial [Gammaproteobacteria bacterium]|nr:hypothetical protein [Gammaproteobacteria bacterium]
ASIGANCNIKICMKLEDPQETWEFFNKVAGETYVTNVQSFQQNSGSMTVNYQDSRSASVDRRQRIEVLDLREQREGQCHIFFKSTIIRADMFFANPKPVKRMRIAHLLKVAVPPDNELTDLDNLLKQFSRLLSASKITTPAMPPNEDILLIQDSLAHAQPDTSPIERGVNSLVNILEHEVQKQQALSAQYEGAELTNSMSAFTSIGVSDIVEQMIGHENVELFALPLIRRATTMEDLKHIERLTGSSAEAAQHVVEGILHDVEKVTEYPPNILMNRNKHKFMDSLNQALAMLGGEQYYDSHMLGKAKLASVQEDEGVSASTTAPPELPELPELPEFDDLESLLQEEAEDEEFGDIGDEDESDKE